MTWRDVAFMALGAGFTFLFPFGMIIGYILLGIVKQVRLQLLDARVDVELRDMLREGQR